MKPRVLLLFLTFVVVEFAWAGTVTERGRLPTSALQEVRVQLKWVHQFQFAGYYAAIHNGYYRDVGLDVSLIEYSPGVTPIDQLMGGRVDFAVADTGALLYKSASVPLVVLAAIFQNSPSILVSRADTGIQELADLRGKRVMLAGGYMNAELMSMLNAVGITSRDIQMVPSVTNIDVLIDGDVDAFNAYTTNELYTLTKRAVPFISFVPRDYGVDFYGDILLTSQAVIDSDPAMVRNFRKASLKGWAYAVEHPEKVVDLILSYYNTQDKSREHLLFEAKELIKLIMPNVVPIGYINEERWRRIETIFREQGLLSQSVDLSRFIYQTDNDMGLIEIFNRYRREIVISITLLVLVLLLSHIVRLKVKIKEHTRELRQAKQHAESEARTDALTGLPNRRYFFEELTRDIAQAERHDIPLTVISVDIDHFKKINDQHGHAAGDEALRRAGNVFRSYLRTGDIAARIGGEEFALACLNTDLRKARQLAERLCQEMADIVIDGNGEPFQFTLSVGIAVHEQGDNVDELLHKADLALYEAKKQGRDRIREWQPQ